MRIYTYHIFGMSVKNSFWFNIIILVFCMKFSNKGKQP